MNRNITDIQPTGTVMCLTKREEIKDGVVNVFYMRQWYSIIHDYTNEFGGCPFQAREFALSHVNLRFIGDSPELIDNILNTPIDPKLRFIKLDYPHHIANMRFQNKNQRNKYIRDNLKKQQKEKSCSQNDHVVCSTYKQLMNLVGDEHQTLTLINGESVRLHPLQTVIQYETFNCNIVYYWNADMN